MLRSMAKESVSDCFSSVSRIASLAMSETPLIVSPERQSHRGTWLVTCVLVLFSGLMFVAPGALARSAGSNVLTGSTAIGRFNHTATLLGNGKVLVAGGMARNGVWLKSAEIYDPARGKFQAVEG